MSSLPAHAKLMCHSEVSLQDAVVAVTVMECSMQVLHNLHAILKVHSYIPPHARPLHMFAELRG